METFYHKNSTINDLRTPDVVSIHRFIFLILIILSVIIVYIGRDYARFNFGYCLSDYIFVIFTLATGILVFECKIYKDKLASQLLPVSTLVSVGLGLSLVYKSDQL